MVLNVNWRVWSVRIILFLILFGFLFLTFMEPEQRERLAYQTDVTKRLYDWWDYKRFEEDLHDVRYFGTLRATVHGDTAGLGINDQFVTFQLMEYFDRYFDGYQYFDYDKILSGEPLTPAEDSLYNIDESQIGYIWVDYSVSRVLGRVFITINFTAGTERNHEVLTDKTYQSMKPRYVRRPIDRFTKMMTKRYAKRFFKIMQDIDQLRFLYRSVYEE